MVKYIVLLAVMFALVGCGTDTTYQDRNLYTSNGQVIASTQATAEEEPVAAATPEWLNQKITGVGQNAANPRFAGNPAQAQAMARRGASLDAKRVLLERVLGLKLNSKTLVKDMVTEADDLQAESSGLVRGSYPIDERFENGLYTVTEELPLYTVYEYMKSKNIYFK